MTIVFLAGAAGSTLAAWSFASGGWTVTCWIGGAIGAAAILLFLTEPRPRASDDLSHDEPRERE